MSPRSEINVTPLVDIVLVLLIIFIVITPAVNDSVHLPLAKHALRLGTNPGEKPPVVVLHAIRGPDGQWKGTGNVGLSQDGTEGRHFDLDAVEGRSGLKAHLSQLLTGFQERQVQLKADSQVPFKQVDALLQVCREGGADEAAVITSEDSIDSPKGGK